MDGQQRVVGMDVEAIEQVIAAGMAQAFADQRMSTVNLATVLGIYNKELKHQKVIYPLRKALLLQLQASILAAK